MGTYSWHTASSTFLHSNLKFFDFFLCLNCGVYDTISATKFGSVVVDFLLIVTLIVGVCNCSMFCCTLLYVHSSIAIILMGKKELVALLNLISWYLVMVERLFLAVPWGCLRFVIVVFPDHTHLLLYRLFLIKDN